MTDLPTHNLLALDTATGLCSVAVSARGRIAEAAEEAGHRHSQRLLPMVDALLADERIDLAQIDAIAFGAGPGSFTGLRIACSVAQGLGWARDVPLVPVGNLAALAHVAFERAGPGANRVLVAIDARMNEVYWAAYAWRDEAPLELHSPALARRADLAALARRHGAELAAGDGWTTELLAAARDLAHVEARAAAGAIAVLGTQQLAAGGGVPAALAAPLYVRDRVALTIAERRAAADGQHDARGVHS